MLFKCLTSMFGDCFFQSSPRQGSIDLLNFHLHIHAWIFLLQTVIFKSWNFNEVQGHFELWRQVSTCLAKLAVKWYVTWPRYIFHVLGPVSRKFRELFEPEKPVVKLQSAGLEKLIFSHVFNVRETKRPAKFDGLEPQRCVGHMKGIVTSKIDPRDSLARVTRGMLS